MRIYIKCMEIVKTKNKLYKSALKQCLSIGRLIRKRRVSCCVTALPVPTIMMTSSESELQELEGNV